MKPIFENLGLAPVAMIMLLPLFAPTIGLGAEPGPSFTAPAEIDRTVTEFTGAQVGEIGGARAPADRRLRLAACSAPLLASWHGRERSTVRVECPDPGGWRIFVAIRPLEQAERAARVVQRGDPITVMVRGQGFSVQQAGEAMESGAIGEWIGIRTARKAAPVRARIERPGLAIIPAQ